MRRTTLSPTHSPRVTAACAGLLVIAANLLVPSGARAQWSTDPTNSNLLCSSLFSAQWLNTFSDGTGGAYFTWADRRGSGATNRVIIQRVVSPGVFPSGWSPPATRVCSVEAVQNEPVAAFDGHAVYVAWTDLRAAASDVYVQRMLPNGTVASGWPAGGVRLSLGGVANHAPTICSNGLGGAVVAWVRDSLAADQNIQAASVDSSGSVKALVAVAGGFGLQTGPALSNFDPTYFPGDVILGYQDNASGNFNIRVVGMNSTLGLDWGPTDICNAVGDQTDVRVVTDGYPYVYFVWNDLRTATPTVYETTNFLFWPTLGNVLGLTPNGTMVSSGTSAATLTSAAPDGNSGLLIGWEQPSGSVATVYAQSMRFNASPTSGWPWYGKAICPGCGPDEREIRVSRDGAGGMIATWRDNRNGGQYDVWAQRIDASSNLGLNWPATGLPVGASAFDQFYPSITPDGSGNVIIAFRDNRFCPTCPDGPTANRVDHFGVLGDPRAVITAVKDVKADQGGNVNVVWNASYLDADPRYAISSYWIWRQIPAASLVARMKAGAAVMDEAVSSYLAAAGASPKPGALVMTTVLAGASTSWEFLESDPASGFPSYAAVVPTTQDSMPGTNPVTQFMVQARTAAGAYWNSAPDSGYSVDNIPPFAPAPAVGNYSAGVAALHWAPVVVPDLANYKVYRGNSSSFVPSPGNLLASPTDTALTDNAGAPHFYRVSAVDIHGNEGPSTLISPDGLADVGGSLPGELSLAPPRPNPARGTTTFAYALPQAGHVRFALYDVSGRQVRLLVDGVEGAGDRSATWDLRDDAGRGVGPGLYLARLEAGGRLLTLRVMALR